MSGADKTDDAAERAHRAASLKERVYVGFTTLAVIIVLRADHGEPAAGLALGTVLVTVAATVCAVYVADLLSHMVVHASLPTPGVHRRMLASTLGAASVAIPPLLCLLLAVVGVWSTAAALLAAMLATLATLVAVGVLAVRRLRIPRFQRILVLGGEAVLALIVIALELLSHH